MAKGDYLTVDCDIVSHTYKRAPAMTRWSKAIYGYRAGSRGEATGAGKDAYIVDNRFYIYLYYKISSTSSWVETSNGRKQAGNGVQVWVECTDSEWKYLRWRGRYDCTNFGDEKVDGYAYLIGKATRYLFGQTQGRYLYKVNNFFTGSASQLNPSIGTGETLYSNSAIVYDYENQ